MYKVILFDFGGVIYEQPKDVIPKILSIIYDKPFDLVKEEYTNYRNDYFTGRINTEKLLCFLSITFKNNKPIEELKNFWLKTYSQLVKPNNDVLNIVKKLRKKYKVYLLSNTTEMSNLHNVNTGIYDNFDGLFMSYKMNMVKSDKEIYKRVLSEVGFNPKECIFIDDSEKNLESAKQISISIILFNVLKDSPLKLKEQLEKLQIII